MFKKLIATIRLRLLEVELADHDEAVKYVRDPMTLLAAKYRRNQISADLAKARANWIALHPPGVRSTWRRA